MITMKKEIKNCKVMNCNKIVNCKSFCKAHYERFIKGKSMKTPIRSRYQHGLSKVHPLYTTWQTMRQRCANPKHPRYKDWGGRGIKVCKRWDNFANFLEDMGERPEGMTLDRIDNNKGYSPENCRWATSSDQKFNSRIRIDNTSGHTGIYWSTANRKWQAKISRKHIGYFNTIEQAIKARKELLT